MNHRAQMIPMLDVRMPESHGFQAQEPPHARWPDLRVIMLSSSATEAEVKLARQYGVAGYLGNSVDRATLLATIELVASGGTSFRSGPSAGASRVDLSPRELEILQHLCRGLSNEDIGRVLGITAETIKSQLKSLFHKLEVSTKAEAVARGYELRLIAVNP